MLGTTVILVLFTTFTAAARWLPVSEKVRGVNLGSQFVIEPWMAKDAWTDIGCGGDGPCPGLGECDEWNCVKRLDQEKADTQFQKHWASWINQSDIQEIKSYGLNTIRIPVGFWIMESLVDRNNEFYPRGGLSYLDQIVGWAADADLHVIIDLHGAPGSQSVDQSFTGHSTHTPGFYTSYNFERAYKFLELMTHRIHRKYEYRTVGVLEVLNEPVIPDQAEHGYDNAGYLIWTFYPEAYNTIRAVERSMNVQETDQLSIQYMSSEWPTGDPKANMSKDATNLLFDTHKYYVWTGKSYNNKGELASDVCNDIDRPDNVIVGECSMALPNNSGTDFSIFVTGAELEKQKQWYRSYWSAQARSYEKAGGWIFWTWKCNWLTSQGADWRWCYQDAVRQGVLSKDASEASSFSMCSG